MLFNKEEKEASKIGLIPTDTTHQHYIDASNWQIWTLFKHFFNLILIGDIDVASTHFVQCNFIEQKIDVVLTYFLRFNFDGRKIDIVWTCFDLRNFDKRKKSLSFWCPYDLISMDDNVTFFQYLVMMQFWGIENWPNLNVITLIYQKLQLIGRLFLT